MNVGGPKPTSRLVFATRIPQTIAVELKNNANKNTIGNVVAFRITAFYVWSRNAGLLLGCYFSRAGIG